MIQVGSAIATDATIYARLVHPKQMKLWKCLLFEKDLLISTYADEIAGISTNYEVYRNSTDSHLQNDFIHALMNGMELQCKREAQRERKNYISNFKSGNKTMQKLFKHNLEEIWNSTWEKFGICYGRISNLPRAIKWCTWEHFDWWKIANKIKNSYENCGKRERKWEQHRRVKMYVR